MCRLFNLNKQFFPQFVEEKIACFFCIILALISAGVPLISNQESIKLSPFMPIYDLDAPKDNMIRQINELVDFSFNLALN